jgi:hypothetical protein
VKDDQTPIIIACGGREETATNEFINSNASEKHQRIYRIEWWFK